MLSRGDVQRLSCCGMVNENNRKLHYRASWDVDRAAAAREGKLGIGAAAPGRVRSPDALVERNTTARDLELVHVNLDRKLCRAQRRDNIAGRHVTGITSWLDPYLTLFRF